jgi:glycosyltransferase involved in cell wall biosynthesis
MIVHTHSSKAGVIGRVAAKIGRTPIIVHTVHGWSFHGHMRPWLRRIFILLEKLCARISDRIIVVAESDIAKGLDEGIGRLEQYQLIRSAIPLSRFNPDNIDASATREELGLPGDAPVLGNIGRFSPQKNPFDWVRVASLVRKVVPDCRFLLVGDGPLREEVEKRCREEGIFDHCIFTGLRRDVPRMLGVMNVFLLTSLWEGLPRIIPQSMAMGLPIIANRADGTVEAIQHGKTGYLCEPGDVNQMAEYCVELLQNPALQKEQGKLARRIVHETFDLDLMIKEIEDLYDQLLTEKDLFGEVYVSSGL